MAAKVSMEALAGLAERLDVFCQDIERDRAMVMRQASDLRWSDDRFRLMIGFLDETMQELLMVRSSIENYLPILRQHINVLGSY